MILFLFIFISKLSEKDFFKAIDGINDIKLAFSLQISLIILPFIDYILHKIGIHILVLRFITHFYSMNLAMLFGMFDYFFSSETGLWEPTKRKQK